MSASNKHIGVIVWVLRRTQPAQLLFLKRSWGPFVGHWWPVAGLVKPGERPKQTALRELQEETGLTPLALYATEHSVPDPSKSGDYPVLVAIAPLRTDPILNDEHTEYQWVDAERAADLVPAFAAPIVESVLADFADATRTARGYS